MTRIQFKGNPIIMASVTITDANNGDYLKNILSMDDVLLNDGLVIKNHSDDRLVVTFEGLSDFDQICILGKYEARINVRSTENITFSKIGSSDISVSIYGR